MKTITRITLVCSLLAGNLTLSYAQAFEGIIEFKKQTPFDTTNYVYYIKGDNIRVDEVGANYEASAGTYLIDLKTKKVIAVSHARRMYFDQPPSPIPPVIKGTPEVIKTKNTKTIFNEKCTEYIVKSSDENSQVSYWIANGKYDFFLPMLKLLNRKDKPAVYFLQIEGTTGAFPFISIETSLNGKDENSRLEVTKIQKKAIDGSKFEIPKGYVKNNN